MNTENHYQETDLGNISLNPRGEYNPEESYEYLDLVVLKGGSYVCLAENGATITGISPESGKTTQYWQVITIPGSLTPEYIAMHDRVVNLSEQVGADAVEVRTAEQNVSGMELNVTQMQEQTRQSAEAAEQSKDSSAGYAASADASRQAAEESKQNIDAQVTGFDNHVAEKTGEAENDIEAARIAANKAIIAQQEQSVNEVARAGIEAISTAQSAAQTATEKAQAAATSEKNAAASETAAKLSEENATKMAEQVATDKEQVAYDRTAVENAKQEMTGSVAQIEQNTQGISELKGDLGKYVGIVDINAQYGNINCNVNAGDIVDTNTINDVKDWVYAIVDCQETDVFVLSGIGGYSPKLYAFLDSENKLIESYTPSEFGHPYYVTDYVIVAPKYSKKLILNSKVYDYESNEALSYRFLKGIDNITGLISPQKYNILSFGIKVNYEYDQSKQIQNIIDKLPAYSVLYFPKGKYVLKSPLVFTKRISLIGDDFSTHDKDLNNGSVLYFDINKECTLLDFKTNNAKCCIKNIYVYSTNTTIIDDRTQISVGNGKSDVFSVTNKYNITGISLPNFSSVVDNVIVRGCTLGISVGTFNVVRNTEFYECITCLNVINDNVISNILAFYCNHVIIFFGGLNIITNIRCDSIKKNVLELNASNSNTISNVNGDYCQEALVVLNNSSYNNISGLSGRCGTLYNNCDESIIQESEYETNCYIAFDGDSSNNKIQISSAKRNPLDTPSEYLVPLFCIVNKSSGCNNDCELTANFGTNSDLLSKHEFLKLCKCLNNSGTMTIHYNGRIYNLKNDVISVNSVDLLN